MTQIVSLRDVCDRIDYGLTASAAPGGGPKFLRITDIDSPYIDWDSVPHCVLSQNEESKFALKTGDVVVARTGASTGRAQWVEVIEPTVFASYLVRLRVGPSLVSRYLGYVLKSSSWGHYVSSVAHGKSAQPNMSASAMADFTFPLPSVSEQRAIAEVLGALDDKIAVNMRVIEKSDQLADAVWRDAVVGGDQVPLSRLARFVNGKAFTKGASGTGRVVIRIAELNSGIGGSTVRSDIEVPHDHLAHPGDLLFAWSGSLTVARWFREEAIVNQHIFKVIPLDGNPIWLLNAALRSILPQFRAIAADKATTMGHIQRRHLDEAVAVPCSARKSELDGLMSGLWRTSLSYEQENLRLASTRDELLPLLMSGKLRVKDAEQIVEEIA